jgi:putative phosphoesterase
MHVGLISDTHGLLRPDVLAHFERVDCILHAGDIGNPGILAELETLAPVYAVFGNTDGFDVRARVKERVAVELEGWPVLVTHGHELGSPRPAALRDAYPDARIIIYGHTHVPLVEQLGDVLVVNPGAAGPARFGLEPSVAILELTREQRGVHAVGLSR